MSTWIKKLKQEVVLAVAKVAKVAKRDPKTARVIMPVLVHLPLGDLTKRGGGMWNLKGGIAWKKSSVTNFQGQPALRVFYGKGSGTSSDPGIGGVAFNAAPPGLPADIAMLSFDVFFDKKFDFGRNGGKFGGFLVGHGEASGYRHSDTGATHRIMFQRKGGAISYIYPPSNMPQVDPALKPDGHGVGYFGDVFGPGTLKIGKWNSIQIGVKVNSFTSGKPNADGLAFLQVNGRPMLRDNIRWRRDASLRVSEICFNTFFGGGGTAPRDCVAYYRNFKLLDWKP